MRVLVVNAGSSSLKLAVVEDGRRVEGATVERWDGEDHLEPLRDFVEHAGRVDAVGHRIVHGGPRILGPTLVDDDVVDYLDSIADLAPLHNPRGVAGIRAARAVWGRTPEVVCVDTSFHADLPPAARTFALPREWNAQWGLRRYGFHGLSHAYAVRRGAELAGLVTSGVRVVSCHLGSGASLAAVVDGRCVDTTMGFTPDDGLVMRTRPGSVDPGLLLWLLEHDKVSLRELSETLSRRSGLAGLSGTDGDLRDVLALRSQGDPDAALAYDVMVHRLRREIGAMAAATGGLDLLVFTGGVGEHEPGVRADAAAGLAHLGVVLDDAANLAARGDADIGAAGAGVRTVVVSASEETEVARETEELLAT